MRIQGDAAQVRIYVGEAAQWEGKPLSAAIVERCRQEGVRLVTVLRCMDGYGPESDGETGVGGLPVVVSIVDGVDRIGRLLRILEPLVAEAIVLVEHVQMLKPTPAERERT